MKPYPPNTPQSRLRDARIAKGLRQTDLATLAGVASSSISSIERAPTLLRPAMAKRLADALGCDPADLLHGGG